eukprot:g13008.t1
MGVELRAEGDWDSLGEASKRWRYCFRDESRYGESLAVRGKGRHSGEGYGDGERKWARSKLWETGVETWRWEWSPEAGMMLGRLALWKGALLVSRTQAFVTGKGGLFFGLGMAGRVVVEGAPHPRGLQIEAYVPASSETCQLHVSIDDLKNLFWDDPQKMWVGKKGDMVVELVKMLYFEYKLETEVADSSVPDGIRLKAHHYSDREPWACLQDYRDSDYDLHWESRRSTTERWGGEGPTGAPAIKTQIVQAESLSKGSEEPGVEKIARRGHVPDVASFDVSDTGSSIATSHSVAAIPDERAVWISQRLRIRSIQNLVDAEKEKEAKLKAWMAIKKRFRGLTLGTAVRISGRLLHLMVYEFPDQPGTLRCLGRASTPSYFPAARTAARGFVRRRNAHQLQQPSPRDHRRRFPALIPSAARTERGMTGDRSELRPQTNEFRESPLTQAPLTEEVVHDGASTVDGDGGHDGLSADHLSAATRPVTDLEVLRRCFWKRTWSTASGNGRHQRPSRGRTAGLETNLPSLEEYVISQTYRTNPSGTEPTIEEPPHGETDARTATAVVQLAIRTRIFRRVIKVAGLGIPPKFLLVVVCQWHDALVVRCYDFLSGVIREAERPDPDRDAALLLEFKSMSRLERDMQLQVMLDELVVFEDTAHASEDSESTWSVRFAEDAGAPIIIDAGSDMYDQQVEEQMAAAAALVDKRREDMQRVQHAAREKDRRARERKNKRDEKRREAQAKSRKKGGKRANGAKRRGRTTRGGERRGAASEDSSDQSQESGDG